MHVGLLHGAGEHHLRLKPVLGGLLLRVGVNCELDTGSLPGGVLLPCGPVVRYIEPLPEQYILPWRL